MMKRSFLWLIFLLTFTAGNVFGLSPQREYKLKPDAYGISYKEVTVKTEDDFSINVWVYQPSPSKITRTTFIMSYADAGNMSNLITRAYNLSQKGYRVITYDYRGFGKSQDFDVVETNLYHDEFVTDLSAVINYTRENFPSDQVALYGISMGTIISAFAAHENKVDFIIGESFINDPWLLMARMEKLRGQNLHLPQEGNGYFEKLSNLEVPFLVFAGSSDILTRLEECLELINVKDNREMIVYNGGHMEGFRKLTGNYPGDRYLEYIDIFISSYIIKKGS